MGGGLFAQKYQPKYLREDNKAFKDLTNRTTENGWIEFKQEARVNPSTFFKNYASSLGLDKDYDFKLLKDETDKKQNKHQRFLLHYKNIPVEGAEFTLHSSIQGVLTLAHGRIPDGLNFDVSKPMPENKALDFALVSMKLSAADFKKNELNKQKGELLLARLSDDVVAGSFRLAYVFDIYGNETLNAFRVYVDASTGEIVKKVSLIHSCFGQPHATPHASPSATANPPQPTLPSATAAPLVLSTFVPNYGRYLNGQASLTFETEPNPANNGQFRLSAFNNALNTRMDVSGNPNPNFSASWATLPDVVNNNGANWQNELNSRNAQTAHWLTQRMHQYLNQTPNIGRNGLNGQGLYPRVVTNKNSFDANWNGAGQITFGRSDVNNNSMATADIVGHEYMHGVTQNTANLIYYGESGALNEGISDIFGTALERNILPNPNAWNWLLGEDLGANLHLRDMANPGAIPNELQLARITQPDRYFGPNWHNVNDGFDFGGVHINSGVLNKWFQTICTGQSVNQYQINPIDFDRATAIVYRALTVYLQSSSNYVDMANATVQSARDLYGNCSLEEEAVQNAWSAAGIGGVYYRSCGGSSNVIANGCYTIKAQHSNKLLQPENGNNGARIRQYDANGSAEQIMEISAADNTDSYIIQSKATGKAFEIPNTASSDIPVQANNLTFDVRQKWLLIRRPDGHI